MSFLPLSGLPPFLTRKIRLVEIAQPLGGESIHAVDELGRPRERSLDRTGIWTERVDMEKGLSPSRSTAP